MKLVYNAVKCNECGDVLWSKHRHDFLKCSCEKTMNDGGLDYRRGSFSDSTDMSIYSTDDFETVRKYLYRFNSIGGYSFLNEITDDWLNNIVEYYLDIKDEKKREEQLPWEYLTLFIKEKQWRAELWEE